MPPARSFTSFTGLRKPVKGIKVLTVSDNSDCCRVRRCLIPLLVSSINVKEGRFVKHFITDLLLSLVASLSGSTGLEKAS